MKRIVVLASILLLSFVNANAQATKKIVDTKAKAKEVVAKTKAVPAKAKAVVAKTPTISGAGMLFESETIDYGTIPHNADGEREFVFVNNGDKPLVISSASGSCGCTVPSAPKEPILPGAKGVIKVKYATSRVGDFSKTVTVVSNAEGQPTKILTIKGKVLNDGE